MNNKRFLMMTALLGISTVSLAQARITLTNPIAVERPDELIVCSKKMLAQKLGNIAKGKFVVFKNKANRPMVVQFDDLDGDGNWDEAAFLYSFAPKEKAVVNIALADHPATIKAVVRAHVRLRKKNPDESFGPSVVQETMPFQNPATDFTKQPLPNYLTEGPAWENDKVAFRQYLDVRNGRDIFGKRVAHMVMDSVGVVVEPSYHDLHDWGMDVLHVGKSLGAGAIAMQLKIAGKDSLVRLGGANIAKTVYTQVSDGPIRAIFRIQYDWTINGKLVKLTDETSICGGQYFYESKITIKGAPAGAKLVEGIASFYDNKSNHFEAGKAAVLYSHGKQSENKDELGMAIMVNRNGFAGFAKAPDAAAEIMNTYLVKQSITASPSVYRFYAGWIYSDQRFATAASFEQFLKNEGVKLSQPVSIL